MNDFYKTQMGQRFYENTMPRIASALEKIAETMEKHKDREAFTCPKCSYGGFEFSKRYIKCMKCGQVYD